MKYVLSLILLLVLAAGGYLLWKNVPRQELDNGAITRSTMATVEARDIEFAVNAAGDIGPADQVSVRPEVNGRIAELPVDIGDRVAKDALLCRLDDRDLQIEKSSRLAEVEGTQLQLIKATRNYVRAQQLFTNKLVSLEQYEDVRTEQLMASNSLDRATSALRLVEDRISKTRILAPFDCTVLTRPISIGQAVSGSGGFNSGTEIMTIANLNDMIVNAHINQADVIRLTKGQEVEIQVESVPGLVMEGALERIAPQAIIKNGIKGFAARVQIKHIDPRIRPGMTAILRIPVASAENVLAVPLAAIFTERTDRYVFVREGTRFERRPVIIGVTDYGYAEVQEGLRAGDTVSLEPPPDYRPETSPPTNGVSRPGRRTATTAADRRTAASATNINAGPTLSRTPARISGS